MSKLNQKGFRTICIVAIIYFTKNPYNTRLYLFKPVNIIHIFTSKFDKDILISGRDKKNP